MSRPIHWRTLREIPADYLRERAVQERRNLRGRAESKNGRQFHLHLHAWLRRPGLRHALLHWQKVSERR